MAKAPENKGGFTKAQQPPPTTKVNFTIGDSSKGRNYFGTTSGAAHEPEKYQNSSRVKVDVPNLRQANFNVGNEKLTYESTAHSIQTKVAQTQMEPPSSSKL